MTNILLAHKHFVGEPNTLEEQFGYVKLPTGTAFLSKVELYVLHVDEAAKDEALRHLFSIPAQTYTYDENNRLLTGDKDNYQGFKWRRVRKLYEFLLKVFGWPFHVYPVKPPLQHSGLAKGMELMGHRFAGQIFWLGEIPDHKRGGTEDL